MATELRRPAFLKRSPDSAGRDADWAGCGHDSVLWTGPFDSWRLQK